MSEAPERIWTFMVNGMGDAWDATDEADDPLDVMYVRKDLFDAVKAENARLKSERSYIVGWNDGFDEAKYQEKHGHPSDGDIAPQYQFTAAEMAVVKADRDKYKARVEALTVALQWCSGSPDFNEGGQARVGWLKLCAPLIERE